MARKKVEFHEEASREALAAFEWYFERSESAASQFAEELGRALERIASAPRRWPEHSSDVRKFTLHRFPFVIFHQEHAVKIQVLAVAHARRRLGYWRTRS